MTSTSRNGKESAANSNGESSAAATPAKGTEDTPRQGDSTPAAEQEEVKEEATPASALKTTVSPARAENSESTVLNQTMKELNSNEIHDWSRACLTCQVSPKKTEGVKEDDLASWLGDDGVETRIKAIPRERRQRSHWSWILRSAARQWLARKAKEEGCVASMGRQRESAIARWRREMVRQRSRMTFPVKIHFIPLRFRIQSRHC